jgi:hypothetical protein
VHVLSFEAAFPLHWNSLESPGFETQMSSYISSRIKKSQKSVQKQKRRLERKVEETHVVKQTFEPIVVPFSFSLQEDVLDNEDAFDPDYEEHVDHTVTVDPSCGFLSFEGTAH